MIHSVITINVKVNHDGCLRRFHFDYDKNAAVAGSVDHFKTFCAKIEDMFHLQPFIQIYVHG